MSIESGPFLTRTWDTPLKSAKTKTGLADADALFCPGCGNASNTLMFKQRFRCSSCGRYEECSKGQLQNGEHYKLDTLSCWRPEGILMVWDGEPVAVCEKKTRRTTIDIAVRARKRLAQA